MNIKNKKFQEQKITSKGEIRASIPFDSLQTLWFNTGSLCNLACANCYMESSPKNKRLDSLTLQDVCCYLDEIDHKELATKSIGITGGEPFVNSDIIAILQEVLSRKMEVLVLTNGYVAIERYKEDLLKLCHRYKKRLKIRVSLDHYSQEIHEKERGEGTFNSTLGVIRWLVDNGFAISVAGRKLVVESDEVVLKNYQELLSSKDIPLQLKLGDGLIIFPEMTDAPDVPEISVGCWQILNKTPQQQMCATSRMVVKRQGQSSSKVISCTLLPYDLKFELGNNLSESMEDIFLNHPYCSQFCVLGGSSCS